MSLLHDNESFFIVCFFELGLTPYKAGQPLQGMELQEKKKKILRHTGNLFRKNLQFKAVC